MRKLKAQLIRLGEENPELREDLTPILDQIEEEEKEGYINGDYGDQSRNRAFYPEPGHVPAPAVGSSRPVKASMRRRRKASGEDFQIVIEQLIRTEGPVIGRGWQAKEEVLLQDHGVSDVKHFWGVLQYHGFPTDPKEYFSYGPGSIRTDIYDEDGEGYFHTQDESSRLGIRPVSRVRYEVKYKVIERPEPEESARLLGIRHI